MRKIIDAGAYLGGTVDRAMSKDTVRYDVFAPLALAGKMLASDVPSCWTLPHCEAETPESSDFIGHRHPWVFRVGAAECEACSGALRGVDDNGDVVVFGPGQADRLPRRHPGCGDTDTGTEGQGFALMSSGKGERRIANPVTKDELTAVFVGLASGRKHAIEALASLAATAIQRIVAER